MAIYVRNFLNRLTPIKSSVWQGKYLSMAHLKPAGEPNSAAAHKDFITLNKIARSPSLPVGNTQTQLFAQEINRVKFNASPIVYCKSTEPQQQSTPDGPSEEQLTNVYLILKTNLPELFVNTLDYSIYHHKIVFENRIRGKTYIGLYPYVQQMSLLRLWGHFKYAYVKFEILKITKHPEDSSVKIRWRVSGITGYKLLFKMIQFKVWRPKEMIEIHQATWIDGFSTMYIDSDGLVYKHIADKLMPDQDKETNPITNVVTNLGSLPKLALFVNLSADLAPTII